MGNAAGVDHDKVRFLRRFDLLKSELVEKLSNLLAFVLVDLAAKGNYRKSSHNVV